MKKPKREHQGGAQKFAVERAGDSVARVPVSEFPFDDVCAALDGQPRSALDVVAAAEAFSQMLEWTLEPLTNKGRSTVATPRMMLLKLAVLRLILLPHSFDTTPTLTALAKEWGTNKQKLSRIVVSFRDRFGVVSTWMKSDSAREAYRVASIQKNAVSQKCVQVSKNCVHSHP